MKIILSFFNAVYDRNDMSIIPCFYESFIKGLQSEGHRLLVVNGGIWDKNVDVSANDRERMRQFNPDCVIAFNNYGPRWSDFLDCPVVVYEVDSPIYYANSELLLANPNRYVYLIIQPHSRQILRRKFGVSDDRIFDSTNFSMIQAECRAKTCNISFVGSRFIGMLRFPWTEFQESRPNQTSRMAYLELLDLVKKNPFIGTEDFEQAASRLGLKLKSSSEETLKLIINGLSTEKRIQVLGEVADLGLDLRGSLGWGCLGGENLALSMAYRFDKVRTFKENQDFYNSSRICININHLQATNGFSWRVCDIMASDGCLVTEYNPGLTREFPDLSLETFTNRYEARERCRYVLENPLYRAELVSRCQEAIDKRHRFSNVLDVFEHAGLDLRAKSRGVVQHSVTFVGVVLADAFEQPMPEIFVPAPTNAKVKDEPTVAPRFVRPYPRVSLFIVTYNQEEYVDETLTGAFEQDYGNLEIVISDDHSTDSTWDIVRSRVESYRKAGGRHKIVLNRNKANLGIIRNIETAMRLSTGELLVANGGDDVSLPSRVRRIFDAWDRDGRRAYAILHGFQMVDPCGNLSKEKLLFSVSPRTPIGAAMAYRREVFEKFKSFAYENAIEDHVFVRRALMLGGTLTISDVLLKYRRGVGASSKIDYLSRRLSICKTCLDSALQTFDDLEHVKGLDDGNVLKARALAVDLLNYYSREYFSYGPEIAYAKRIKVFRILNRFDPVPIFSRRFLIKRLTCIFPRTVNLYGRCLLDVFRHSFFLKALSRCVCSLCNIILYPIRALMREIKRISASIVSLTKKIIKPKILPLWRWAWLKYYRRKCERSLARLSECLSHSPRKVRVAFLQLFPASNQNFRIFELMTKSADFDPYFVVCFDVFRDKLYSKRNYDETLALLRRTYGEERVLEGLDKTGRPRDFTAKFDLMTTSNPYEQLVHKEFQVLWWTRRGVPSFYLSYFYLGKCYVTEWNLKMPALSCFTRVYVENAVVVDCARRHQLVKGANCVLTGSAKMDGYAQIKPVKRTRKRIILAPHHAVETAATAAGSFLYYSSDLLKLVKEFPEVDFVFRPHPLLFQKLRDHQQIKDMSEWGRWGDKKVDDYFRALRQMSNVIISPNGDYLQEFADSDAMIHDCGSFSAEYLYTGKPCAYVWRKTIDVNRIFTPFGVKCINAHYIVHSPEDIRAFIRNVVIGGRDPKKTYRKLLAKREVMVGYPNASKKVMADLRALVGLK